MRRARSLAVAVLALVTAAAPLPATGAGTTSTAAEPLPRRIDLPRGWQPEGITTDGRTLYVGSLAGGGLWQVNPRTGERGVLWQGKQGRVAVGVDYDRRRDLLWVAGGPTGKIRAHDADTGRVMARYSFGSGRFVNDLTVTRRGVYATDSFGAELAVVPLPRRSDRLPPRSAARTLELTGDYAPVPDSFNLNGIVRAGGWLLAVQSVNGELFRINPRTGVTRQVAVTGARLVNGDGLERRGDVLYVVRNRNNKVVALELDARRTAAERVAVLRHPDLDVPATAAAAYHRLWAVNARFGTEPMPRTKYWITRLRLARP